MKPILLAIAITILINLLYMLNITKNTNDYWERKAKEIQQTNEYIRGECKQEERIIKNIFDCPALPADIEE